MLNWALHALVVPTLGSLLLMDVHSCLTDDDKVYFRKQREERFGKKLEEVRLLPSKSSGLSVWCTSLP